LAYATAAAFFATFAEQVQHLLLLINMTAFMNRPLSRSIQMKLEK